MPIQGQELPHSRLRSTLRWVPAGTILMVTTLCWIRVLRGGVMGTAAEYLLRPAVEQAMQDARNGVVGVATWYLLQLTVPLLGLVGLAMVLVCAVWQCRFSGAMFATLLASVLAIWQASGFLGIMPTLASIDSTVPSTTVRLPANVALRVLWGGDTLTVNYHATVPGQRWAYDFAVEPYLTGSKNLEAYGCYGVPVVAPVAGRVVSAHDGEPDQPPGELSNNFKVPTGNHVVMELATGTYILIAHLKRGSVRAEAGQEMAEGQVIGQCGNSGNTTEPHIHIHHQRQNPAPVSIISITLAEGLPLYFRDHAGPPMPEGGMKEDNGKAIATGMVVQHNGLRR